MAGKMLRAVSFLASLLLASSAFAQSVVVDQFPLPFNLSAQSEILVQSLSVAGGTLYLSAMKPPGAWSPSQQYSFAQSFVPVAVSGLTRFLPLTNAKSDAGVALTATATGGAMGISRVAGTSLVLVGEATSSDIKTDSAAWDFVLPDSYIPGADIALSVNCNYSGAGTINANATSLIVVAYSESSVGIETVLAVSDAQLMPGSASVLVFTIAGTGLTPGSHVVVELTITVTSTSGSNTGQINSVSYGG